MTRTAPAEVALDATERPMLRFLTCGSVDDGKSTLIGHLLYEQNLIFDDQLAALRRDTQKHGTTGEAIDFALLVDGLEAERQQGITIDVAYRYFRTAHRAFIVADTPGHEQYTRNMATGASNADLAILLVDARKGLLTQTYRHATIVSLLGIRHVVLAVNKIDLVDYSEGVFTRIVEDFRRFADKLAFVDITAIPLSAKNGDNLSTSSARTPWYRGPALVAHLEQIDITDPGAARAFRMPVQWINRPNLDFRGFAGTIAAGRIAQGDELMVAGSGRISSVARIVTYDGDVAFAERGAAVTLTLADEIDAARGDVFVLPRARPQVGRDVSAHLIWMGDEPLRFGRSYLMKLATRTVPVTVSALSYKLDVDTFAQNAATTLRLNEVGLAVIAANAPIAFDTYVDNPTTGAFILIDRESNATVAAGMIEAALRSGRQVQRPDVTVSRTDRARLKHQRPGVLWFTGPSGSSQTAIAARVESRLNLSGVHTMLLDDDVGRARNAAAGDLPLDHAELLRRTAETARLMTDAGLIVLCAVDAPFRAEREVARGMARAGEFVEIFIEGPMAADASYEAPLEPEIVVGREGEAVDRSVDRVLEALVACGFIDRFDDLADWSI